MKTRGVNTELLARIMGYYCFFYAGIKLYGIMFGNLWPVPHGLLAMGLLLLGGSCFYLLKAGKLSWGFVILAMLLISALRYWEADLVVWLQQIFS